MPLMVMSPNIQELDSPSRKRNHEEYSESDMSLKPDMPVGSPTLGLMSQRPENEQQVPSDTGRRKSRSLEKKIAS